MCEYCKGSDTSKVDSNILFFAEVGQDMFGNEINFAGYIHSNARLRVEFEGNDAGFVYRDVEIKFCPMCGRKLKGGD